DQGNDISIDGSGCVYITGEAGPNYDVTPGAFRTTYKGMGDIFVTKLNTSGSSLVYSTYVGGSKQDWSTGITVDGSGCAYITGMTTSTDYDVTPGAFQTTHAGGNSDVFVTKLNPSGSALVYSTYIGGTDQEWSSSGIAVDGSGCAYVTGSTYSFNYDITTGAFQTTNGGISDVFVTKLNASGSGLLYSTYIGGNSGDGGSDIVLDGSG
ncbi:MAG: SBBP repeat-containing protein, partial [Bacteroidia bacterium]|nr:SBBP repeat-containing protein [Bacteroidia bacterium]